MGYEVKRPIAFGLWMHYYVFYTLGNCNVVWIIVPKRVQYQQKGPGTNDDTSINKYFILIKT